MRNDAQRGHKSQAAVTNQCQHFALKDVFKADASLLFPPPLLHDHNLFFLFSPPQISIAVVKRGIWTAPAAQIFPWYSARVTLLLV